MGVIKEFRSNSRHHSGDPSLSGRLTSPVGRRQNSGSSFGTEYGSSAGGDGDRGGSLLRIQPAATTATTTLYPPTTTTTNGLHRNLNQLRNRLIKNSLPNRGNNSGSDSILTSSLSSSSSSSLSSSSLSSSKLGPLSSSSISTLSPHSSSTSSSSPSSLLSSSSASVLSSRSSSSSLSVSSYSSSSSLSAQNKQSGPESSQLFRKFPFKYQAYNAGSDTNGGRDNDNFDRFPDSKNVARYADDRMTHTALDLKPYDSAFKHDPDRTQQSQPYSHAFAHRPAQNLSSPSLSSSSSSFLPQPSSQLDSFKRNDDFSQPSALLSSLSSSSSSPSPSRSNLQNSLYNLGLDHGSTLSPMPNPAVDLLSPTGESFNSLNISEICYNSSASASTLVECWNLFDPNDNFTSSDSSTPSPESSTSSSLIMEERYWAILLVIFPLFTVFGNVLVVLSVFKEKSLKTVTNYFICSLAVADIMVAVAVMPLAVYMEVTNNVWTLSDPLCDAWVASDVLACTASILNLTAISVDRFIAVTQPIKYAKHKNSKRVFIMLAVTWVISVAIAAPIALGVNYSEDRKPGLCRFFNSDFLIYSSMGSFYIPSIIMIFLYWKIYRVIRQRALKAKKVKQLKNVDKRALQGVIENPQATSCSPARHNAGGGGATMVEATVTTGLAKMDNGRVTTYNTTTSTRAGTSLLRQMSDAAAGREGNIHNAAALSEDSHDDDDDDDEETPSGSGSGSNNNTDPKGCPIGLSPQRNAGLICNVDIPELITNPMAEAIERQEAEEEQAMLQIGNPQHEGADGVSAALPVGHGGSGASGSGSASTSGAGVSGGQTCANEAETNFGSPTAQGNNSENTQNNSCKRGHKKGVTKFNFHMRTSRKRKEKSSSKREKKATKTLAIVLGGFLICWVPFFTLNIISAICIRYKLDVPICHLEPIYFGMFVWLGYINSFLNPAIYTIFNPEFRKAFRKLLTEPCNS